MRGFFLLPRCPNRQGGPSLRTALTIAGSDPSGGAGIQADIKTMAANGIYAMSAITALTAQNTTGVYGIMEVPPEFLCAQIETAAADIPPDAAKIGMVPSKKHAKAIFGCAERLKLTNIVTDPVLLSTSGTGLIPDDDVKFLADALFPISSLITPNIPEAERLSGFGSGTIGTKAHVEQAARILQKRYGCAVLIKGGHAHGNADDFLITKDGNGTWITGRRIENPNTHGTGCTLSSAICAFLAKGMELERSVVLAKEYVTGAIASMMRLGNGRGPLNHLWKNEFTPETAFPG